MTKILYMVLLLALSLAVTFAQEASAYKLPGDSVFPKGIAYDGLLVVNTQFDRMQGEQGPELPFVISSVSLQALAGDNE